MPEGEEKGHGFSRLHMLLIISDPVHQWQGDNDAVKSHGKLSLTNIEGYNTPATMLHA